MKLKLFLSLVVAAGLMTANFQTNASESLSATLVIINARVHTMDPLSQPPRQLPFMAIALWPSAPPLRSASYPDQERR